MAGGGGTTLEYTPTWVVAVVCTAIVAISLLVERILHFSGKTLKKRNQKQLFEALQKIKEELMLLGFISLLMAVGQGQIAKICIPKEWNERLLPCKKKPEGKAESTAHFQTLFLTGRHLLAGDSDSEDYCSKKGKAPLLSLTALHELHIFIFVLAVAHVIFCALTIIFGTMKIRIWKHWEDEVLNKNSDAGDAMQSKFIAVQEHDFIKGRFLGVGKADAILGWLQSFFKQFFGSVTKSDYITLRLGFITMHCKSNPKFNFHKYLMRALEHDFKKVVGISWYLWLFVVVFLLLNISGWHIYFWLAFVPLILLLVVGAKLEHVITELAHEVAEKHVAVEGELVVRPSDEYFWFGKPKIVLFLIHFILFQNSFELAFFFFIWVQYSFDSCIMEQIGYIIPRLFVGVLVQVLCSYSTLPLYAIVTQMGSSFKAAIFNEQTQQQLVGWAKMARKGVRKAAGSSHGGPTSRSSHDGGASSHTNPTTGAFPGSVQLAGLRINDSPQENKPGAIAPENKSCS